MDASRTTFVNEDELGSKDTIASTLSYITINELITSRLKNLTPSARTVLLTTIVVIIILIIVMIFFFVDTIVEKNKSKLA